MNGRGFPASKSLAGLGRSSSAICQPEKEFCSHFYLNNINFNRTTDRRGTLLSWSWNDRPAWVQAAKMGFLRRMAGSAVCEQHEVELLLLSVERSQLRWLGDQVWAAPGAVSLEGGRCKPMQNWYQCYLTFSQNLFVSQWNWFGSVIPPKVRIN